MKRRETVKERKAEPQAKNGKQGFRVRYIFYFAAVLMLVLAIFSYHSGDIAILDGGSDELPANWIGPIGARLAWAAFSFLGLGAYLLATLLTLAMIRAVLPGRSGRWWMLVGGVLLLLGTVLLLALSPTPFADWCDRLNLRDMPGGVVGQFIC